jgi:hypothetical protein
MVRTRKFVKTRAALAAALGVSPVTLSLWVARGAPGKTKLGYSVEAMRKWREENIGPSYLPKRTEGESHAGSPSDKQRLEKAQADQREALAALAALKLSIERGEYRSLKDVEEWDRSRASLIKRGLLSLGRSVAPAVVGLEVKQIEVVINKKARELLGRFARI